VIILLICVRLSYKVRGSSKIVLTITRHDRASGLLIHYLITSIVYVMLGRPDVAASRDSQDT